MSKPTRKQKILVNIYKNVYQKKKWECIVDGCSEQSVNSHLLQQKGVLNSVTVDGHLMEFKQTDIFSWTRNIPPFDWKRVGISKAFSLPLFCKSHDSSLFKKIESHPIDLNSYGVHLLLSYRVVCAEIRKKEMGIELYKRILNSETLKGEMDLDRYEELKFGSELGIKDLRKYKELCEKEFDSDESNFTFKVFKYPLVPIYGSATFSPIDFTIDLDLDVPFSSVFIHIIPYLDALNIIVGYNNHYVDDWILKYVDSWGGLKKKELQRRLTNLFAGHIENWGMSPSLYEKLKKENMKLFVDYTIKNIKNISRDQPTDFNLFEDEDKDTLSI